MDKVVPLSFPVGDSHHSQNQNTSENKARKKPAEKALVSTEDEKNTKESQPSLMAAINQIQIAMQNLPIKLEVSIDKKTEKIKICVVDALTHELIKEIYPKDLIKVAQKLRNKNLNFCDWNV